MRILVALVLFALLAFAAGSLIKSVRETIAAQRAERVVAR